MPVNDATAFFSSPSGQSFANKLPLVSHELAMDMQEPMIPLIQRMQAAARDLQAKLTAAADSGSAPAAH
jgi:hypothetical protein